MAMSLWLLIPLVTFGVLLIYPGTWLIIGWALEKLGWNVEKYGL
jgi:hypothetical protein